MRFIKLIAGLCLLPFCFGATVAFLTEASNISRIGNNGTAFLSGALIYILVHFLLKPRFLYVFSHELTHVLWSLLFKGKIKSFYASKHGGEVHLTKSNFLVALAPYFFPLYTALVVLISFFIDEKYTLAVFFLIGFTLAMHILSTIDFLKVEQPDVMKHGVIFSMTIVLISNILVLTAIMKFVSPTGVSISRFLENTIWNTLQVYGMVYRTVTESL